MTKVSPGKPRADITRTADGMQVRIRGQRKSYGLFLLVFWALLFFSFLATGFDAASRSHGQVDYFALFFPLLVMVLFFIPVIWFMLSVEVVRINSRELAVGRKLLGLGRMREFELASVKDLRSSPQIMPWGGYGMQYMTLFQSGGAIAFDYGFKTYRFGSGLEEAEAKYLVKEIGLRFPALVERDKAA
jgi:hypothetical protein